VKDNQQEETNSITLDEETNEHTHKRDGKTIKHKVIIRSAMRKEDGTKYLFLMSGRRAFFIDEEHLDDIMESISNLNWEPPKKSGKKTQVEDLSDDDGDDKLDRILDAVQQLGKNQSSLNKRLKKLEKGK